MNSERACYRERAQQLRNDPNVHCNCAQAVLIPFADACGISEEQARALASHFGGGLKMGSVCGAIAGGAMVIGMMDGKDEVYQAFVSAMRARHGGAVTCDELVQQLEAAGGDRKRYCDGLIAEAVEEIVRLMNLG